MDLLVQERHEFLYVAVRLHRKCGHDDGDGADVAASVLQLAKTVDIEAVRRSARVNLMLPLALTICSIFRWPRAWSWCLSPALLPYTHQG